jgi:hypothetical protein
MTRFGQNSLEVAVAVGTIMVGTVIMHLIVSWWRALAAKSPPTRGASASQMTFEAACFG